MGLNEDISALVDAARRGDLDFVKEFSRRNSKAAVAADDDDRTALHWACASNQFEVAKYLVEEVGADINTCDDEGWRPLHSAASAGHCDVVALLLRHDVKTDVKTSSGATPLHYAAAKGHLRVVEALVSAGCPLEEVDKLGHSAICRAVSAGKLAVVESLIKAGAQLMVVTEKGSGDSVLHLAVNNQDAQMCRVLCSAVPSLVTAKNKNGQTPLDMAPGDLRKVLDEYSFIRAD